MTLNEEQREGTRRELRRNLELSDLTVASIAVELGFSEARVETSLH